MNTIDAMKMALDQFAILKKIIHGGKETIGAKKFDQCIASLREAIAREEAPTAEAEPVIAPYISQAHFDRAFPGPALAPTGEREALIEQLLEDAAHHKELAHSFDMRPEDSINWQHALNCKNAADMLAADAQWEKLRDPAVLHVNLLRGLPARLSKAQLLHLLGADAQQVAVPQTKLDWTSLEDWWKSGSEDWDTLKGIVSSMLSAAPQPPKGDVK